MADYSVESYWSEIAERIAKREVPSLLAGDDDPFLQRVQEKIRTKFLSKLDLRGKVVLEVGCGPGGNLLFFGQELGALSLVGVDVSQPMLDLAAATLEALSDRTMLRKSDGRVLPLETGSVDVACTVTVLHHNPDSAALRQLVAEMCRVTRESIVAVEETGHHWTNEQGSYIRRPLAQYVAEFEREGFVLTGVEYLDVRASRMWHAAVLRLLTPRQRPEGAPIGLAARRLIAAGLVVTRRVDDLVPEASRWTKMVFHRSSGRQ